MIWRAVAEHDLTEAYLHIGAESPEAAERLLDAVEGAVALLLENPEAGQPREFRSPRAQGLRSWMPRDFTTTSSSTSSRATTSRSFASYTAPETSHRSSKTPESLRFAGRSCSHSPAVQRAAIESRIAVVTAATARKGTVQYARCRAPRQDRAKATRSVTSRVA